MKKFLLIVPIALTAAFLSPESAKSQTPSQFYCGVNSDGKPATMVRSENGKEVAIINWVKDAFVDAGWDNQRRCETVSERFEKYKQLGELNYLTTGKMNGSNVICVARGLKKDCSRDLNEGGLLLTVRPGVNPTNTLKELLTIRERGGLTLNETGDRMYVNMQCLISAGDSDAAYEKCSKSAPLLSSTMKAKPNTSIAPKTSGSLF